MTFSTNRGIRYYTFDSFPAERLNHGILTREGGVSPKPWASLNVGGTVGDEMARVSDNRTISLEALEIDKSGVYESWQVHGKRVVNVTGPRAEDDDLIKADGLITSREKVALMMRFADCVPIMLVDPVKQAIGLVHAGWRGTLKNVAGAAVESMRTQFGTNPEDLIVGLGPSIGPDHYAVGPEVVQSAKDIFRDGVNEVINEHAGHSHFNLWQANRILLQEAGVTSIEVAGICTACHLEDWYSHRAEHGQTGRFSAIIQWVG
jgi:YfiH family protein